MKLGKRNAVSPVLAVVIMIAVTMVGGVATAAFAFGLFGTMSATADISVTRLVCVHGPPYLSRCTAYLENTGDAPTSAVACSLSGGSSILTGSPKNLPPGTSTYVSCRNAPAATFAGEPVKGTFTLESGISIPFEGLYT